MAVVGVPASKEALKFQMEFPFFRLVLDPLTLMDNVSGNRLISEDKVIPLNEAFISTFGPMRPGQFDTYKDGLLDLLSAIAKGEDAFTKLQSLELATGDSRVVPFYMKALEILKPARGGRRSRKSRRERERKRKTRQHSKNKRQH